MYLYSEAASEGWDSYYNGLERVDNPYEVDTWDYESWDYGWLKALDDTLGE